MRTELEAAIRRMSATQVYDLRIRALLAHRPRVAAACSRDIMRRIDAAGIELSSFDGPALFAFGPEVAQLEEPSP